MKITHTPGPWKVKNIGSECYVEGATFVCDMQMSDCDGQGDREMALANARLIAAAPDLLEACEAQHRAIDMLFAMLISKVDGFFPSKSGKPWEAILAGKAAIAKTEQSELAK